MKKLIPLLALVSIMAASAAELRTPLDLECSMWGLQPSEIQNPKAVDWWETQSKMDGVELYINQQGVHLSGAMIEKTWEAFNGNITDWRIEILFGQNGERYNRINLSTLTGGGFFYINYDPTTDDNDPNYKVKCEEVNLMP